MQWPSSFSAPSANHRNLACKNAAQERGNLCYLYLAKNVLDASEHLHKSQCCNMISWLIAARSGHWKRNGEIPESAICCAKEQRETGWAEVRYTSKSWFACSKSMQSIFTGCVTHSFKFNIEEELFARFCVEFIVNVSYALYSIGHNSSLV